jgi:hypothetical protein
MGEARNMIKTSRTVSLLELITSHTEKRFDKRKEEFREYPVISGAKLYRFLNKQRYNKPSHPDAMSWLDHCIGNVDSQLTDEMELDAGRYSKEENDVHLSVEYAINLLAFNRLSRFAPALMRAVDYYPPVIMEKLRDEYRFALRLNQFVDYYNSLNSGYQLTVEHQVRLPPYYVDVLLTIRPDQQTEDSPAKCLAIEFDEEYHRNTRQREKDRKRDRFILDRYGIKTIRIDAESIDAWFELQEFQAPKISGLVEGLCSLIEAQSRIKGESTRSIRFELMSGELENADWLMQLPTCFPSIKQKLHVVGETLKQGGYVVTTKRTATTRGLSFERQKM